jgi:HSP20 family protein
MLRRREACMGSKLVKPEFPFLRRLGGDVDWFFDRFGFDRPLFDAATAMWTPYVEVFEKADELVVRAELPGLKKEQIKVEIADGELTISGERREEEEKKEKDFYRSERKYGSFLRTIGLPEGATLEKATATVKDGVLEVKIPVAKVETPRRRLDITGEATTGENAGKHAA